MGFASLLLLFQSMQGTDKIMPHPFPKSSYTAQLKAFITGHHELMQILQALREIEAQAYLAAGVIRNSIWAQLHEQAYPLHQTEIDVVYFGMLSIRLGCTIGTAWTMAIALRPFLLWLRLWRCGQKQQRLLQCSWMLRGSLKSSRP